MTRAEAHGDDALRERRVLVVAPTARDASLIVTVLGEGGIETWSCGGLPELCAAAARGAGALLLPEEALRVGETDPLRELLSRQPSWSDLPVLLLAARGADSPRVMQAVATLGNVTVLERPTRLASLLSAVRSALRARTRQYQIRDNVAELERVAEALREVDRRKDEFLAMLAHELRNPLAPIRNSLQLLRDADADPLAIATLRSRMDRQVDIIVRLVDDLLEVSRITRGQIELRNERVDLAAVLDSAVETARPAIDEAGHELSLSLPAGRLPVDADPLRLSQVFANLLNNAAKYTDRGGRIAVTAEREGDGVRVSVSDSGIGIRRDMLDRVFDMFTQADGSRDRAPGGLGIGLTLVRRLVELHGGRVEAHSAGPGHGSEFLVRLPLAAAASAPQARDTTPADGAQAAVGTQPAGEARAAAPARDAARGAAQAAVAALAGVRLLVVDDNQDAADSLALLLRRGGASVRVAHSGADALALLGEFRPTVALLDIGMPHMNGYELAARIRKRGELQPIVLVALTGWGQEADRRRSHEAGFDHHLVKPVAPRELQSLLASLAAEQHATG